MQCNHLKYLQLSLLKRLWVHLLHRDLEVYHNLHCGFVFLFPSHLRLVAGSHHFSVQSDVFDEAVLVPPVHFDEDAVFEELSLQSGQVVGGEVGLLGDVGCAQAVEVLVERIEPEVPGNGEDGQRDDSDQD